MRRKKIKHLKGKNKRLKLKKVFYMIFSLMLITTLVIGVKHMKDMYVTKNIEDSKIEFYMDIADEAGKNMVQISWKELLAIDMVIYNNDLKNVRKSDALNRARKFLQSDKNGNGEYSVKSLDSVTKELHFTNEEVDKVNKNLKGLEYTFLGNKKLSEKSDEVIFINKIKKQSIENYKEYGVLPSITIAQCILESGWGKSELAIEGKNLFGIKANSSWDGKSVDMTTSENYNDKIVATFRAYDSISDSINDHGKFLSENSRYEKNGLFRGRHYTTQAQALENAGYSTKENEHGEKIYADMLINLIRKYNLQLIDCEVYR